jgi:fructosamine-3-kinase
MKSRTKAILDNQAIRLILKKAGLNEASEVSPLGRGEFNSVYLVKDKREYVLKVSPFPQTKVLTYENEMMKSELFWYQQLKEKTTIKTPEIFFSDFSHEVTDVNFFLMEKVEGVSRDKFQATKEEKENLIKKAGSQLAEMHKIHNSQFGYIQNGLYNNWFEAVKHMTENLIADCLRAGHKSPRGELLLQLIDKYREILCKVQASMVDFDVWDANIICQRKDGEIESSWIDVERGFWGDPIWDFVNTEVGYPLESKTLTLEGYNSVAEVPVNGNAEEKIRYKLGLAFLALIMEAEKYYRYSPLSKGWIRNNLASSFFFKQAVSDL